MNPDDTTAETTRKGNTVEILLAEDNPNDVEMTRRALEKGRIVNNLSVVTDGVEAMAYLRQDGEYEDAPRPDIILLDLEMPRKDGKEVLEELADSDSLSQIPVVVLTSSEAEQDIVESYRHNANAYMTKPVGYQAFQETIREFERFWFEVVKLPESPTNDRPT
ncbi:response regulator [Natrarchaeobius chitinivorans]|uniref:Response regulator n=1 Tax=Natrarchaeobius chitinivorans TaxID=1679083 RepID=A0A3N6P8P2_NATCH|nr:response regulator [Natrarchaeobius chitinivorans]RQG95059.1 response regulator [Natrarchaeobius chitinivorans]